MRLTKSFNTNHPHARRQIFTRTFQHTLRLFGLALAVFLARAESPEVISITSTAAINFSELAALNSYGATTNSVSKPVHSSVEKAGSDAAEFVPEVRGSFQALLDNHAANPPDTQGAVGPEHLMVVLNTEIAIQSRQGKLLSKVSLANFWASTGHTNNFDTRVTYDPLAGRFITVALSDRRQPTAAVLVGVSRTNNPLGDWDLSAIRVDSQGLLWADYPNIGFNRNWIAVTANIVDTAAGTNVSADVFVFAKDSFGDAAGPRFTRFSETNIFTLVPAVTLDEGESNLYLLTEFGSDRLRLSELSGTADNVTYKTNVAVTAPAPAWIFSTASTNSPGGTNSAPQKGTDVRIFANDSRMQSVMQRNGSLWAVHHIFLAGSANDYRSSIQWWQLTTQGGVVQRGRVDDPGGQTHYSFPSIAVNKSNDVLIGYSRFSPDRFASGFYSYRLAGDPPNTLREDTLLKEGLAPYARLNSRGRVSWGDYSATLVDPLNGMDMWTMQEYAETPDGDGDRWGTWWGYIGFSSNRPPVIVTQPVSQTILQLGNPLVLTVEATGTEPLTYQWWRNGFPLEGETNATYTLESFSPGRIGTYSVIVSNIAGYAPSENALIAVARPAITAQPKSQTVPAGGTLFLSVSATGTQPIFYQWMFNGKNVPDAVNNTLVITNFQAASAGAYSVLVSSAISSVISSNALVTLQTATPAQFLDPAFQTDGSFAFRLKLGSQGPTDLESSKDLIAWTKFFSLTNTGVTLQLKLPPPNTGTRFYRAVTPQ